MSVEILVFGQRLFSRNFDVYSAYRGSNAKLLAVDTDNFCAKVQIEKGVYDGRVLKAVEYEDICKLA